MVPPRAAAFLELHPAVRTKRANRIYGVTVDVEDVDCGAIGGAVGGMPDWSGATIVSPFSRANDSRACCE